MDIRASEKDLPVHTYLYYKIYDISTAKSFSEAPILASTNPQYDKTLFIDLPVQYMKTTSQNYYTAQ